MYFEYRRDMALDYAKSWVQVGNPLYPDLTSIASNNPSFIYQILENGGFYSKKKSEYLDYFKAKYYPTISRVDFLISSLKDELNAIVYTSTDFVNLPGSQTGDILITEKNGFKIVYFLEVVAGQVFFYSQNPTVIRRSIVPNADTYYLYILPDYTGEY